ncbi:hypothetical protein HFN63_36860 [Rhizobium leguminosarum]|nr:hypothetical protein [Rhizobium leguminosarum]MBY5775482.1 hypothetical protein [Rhizobium leguminosarum]
MAPSGVNQHDLRAVGQFVVFQDALDLANAIHVFCQQERLRGDRFARHWQDVTRLDEAGLATAAMADRELANAVALRISLNWDSRFRKSRTSVSLSRGHRM